MLMITLYAEQKKRHRFMDGEILKERSLGLVEAERANNKYGGCYIRKI